MATIEDELIDKPQVKCISIGIHMYAETYRRQNTRNTVCNDQAVDIQDKSTKKNQLEIKYNVPLVGYSFITKPQFIPPNVSYNKTAYIIHWLENVSKAMNIKNIGFLISKQSSISYNQFDIELQDARHICSNNNRFHMKNRHKNNFEDYNKVCNINTVVYIYIYIYIYCLCFLALKQKFYLERRCICYMEWYFHIILQKRNFESTSSGKGKCRNWNYEGNN